MTMGVVLKAERVGESGSVNCLAYLRGLGFGVCSCGKDGVGWVRRFLFDEL